MSSIWPPSLTFAPVACNSRRVRSLRKLISLWVIEDVATPSEIESSLFNPSLVYVNTFKAEIALALTRIFVHGWLSAAGRAGQTPVFSLTEPSKASFLMISCQFPPDQGCSLLNILFQERKINIDELAAMVTSHRGINSGTSKHSTPTFVSFCR